MKLLGFEIKRKSTGRALRSVLAPASGVGNLVNWTNVIREAFPGAWQSDLEMRPESILSFTALFACHTLIQSDIGKMRFMLMRETASGSGIYGETTSSSYTPVLSKPNSYQIHNEFKEAWINSKLRTGNAYILMQRDGRGVVTAMHVLDPTRCRPLVASDGGVYYELQPDYLAQVSDPVVVPSSEIMHDRMNCLFHPLCGVSPLFAAALPAIVGLEIERNSGKFFANGQKISGTITVPGAISADNAKALSDKFNQGYTGENAGKIAILSDGLKFTPLTMTSTDAQLIDQLKMSEAQVCSAYHVPGYKVGVGTLPSYDNIGKLNQDYYATCLQTHIEKMEELLYWGLESDPYTVQLDIDALLRMDVSSQYETYGDGIKNTILSPNEARKKLGLPPVPGGDAPLSQQQNYSLEALAKRDALADPFVINVPNRNPEPGPGDAEVNEDPSSAKYFDAIVTARFEKRIADEIRARAA
jgi:HK97 family phage portal protein